MNEQTIYEQKRIRRRKFGYSCLPLFFRGRGTAFAVDEVFFRLWNKIKCQLKRWYTSSVPSGQLPLLRGEAICTIAVHTLLTHSKTLEDKNAKLYSAAQSLTVSSTYFKLNPYKAKNKPPITSKAVYSSLKSKLLNKASFRNSKGNMPNPLASIIIVVKVTVLFLPFIIHCILPCCMPDSCSKRYCVMPLLCISLITLIATALLTVKFSTTLPL